MNISNLIRQHWAALRALLVLTVSILRTFTPVRRADTTSPCFFPMVQT